ncbi:TPA: AAA family protein disaggregase ClpG [Pseudomonas aeruginosa]|nr:AAA family protein disaggregase ClpG [Pseudomonas aeruginosa]HCF5146075.1 AAA family protein disaggregase ClpG [Pseudomonas aeruginosa]HCF7263714.1 AAA family protein disaggregase ClpG [Pseudomonas aeruginosa]HEJ1405647.1 AAA family protein disaggregase ClpG [Pseudomonas aeruginosa]
MAQELCAICHERPAVARVSLVQNGQRRELALCELHYRQLMRQQRMRSPLESLFGGGSPFDEIFSGFGEQSPVTPVRAREPEAVDIAEYFSKQTTEYLQRAAQVAAEFGKREVDTEHLLYALADADVVQAVLKQFGLSPADLKQYIEANAVRGASKGEASEDMTISPRVKSALQHAFALSRELGHSYVGPEHLLLGLAAVPDSFAGTLLKKYGLTEQALRQKAVKVVGKGAEDGRVDGPSNTPQLDKFSRDLTRLAREGKLDPVIGRSKEVETTIEVLARRKKNNPVLIGEPGVGKTAIVEGLAQRMVQGEVPEVLRDKRLVELNINAMVAGAKYRGEFEERLKQVMDELQAAQSEIILFIDEVHTIVGAGQGGGEGGLDVANVLKPAMARGEMNLIGATTLNEYQKYIEKDAALERRFQPVFVPEPTVEQTISILRGLRDKLEGHHKVTIRDEAFVAAAELSDRYIGNRFLPDKAIDLIDQAAARVRIASTSRPAEIQELEAELAQLKREQDYAASRKWYDEAKVFEKRIQERKEHLEQITERWQQTQGSKTEEVRVEDIAEIISRLTGIPVTELTAEEREKLLQMEERLHQRVIGQQEAITAVSDAVRLARAGLRQGSRPIATFLFLGPTGVGKTELAKALAEVVFGDEDAMIRIDMSEYMERHAVSRLIGAPPGYVGYDEGGQLTERVRRRPYSVILLDEIEKAHADVNNILLQVFDDGRLTDGKGRVVDFTNTIIIATSNLGSELIMKNAQAGEFAQPPEKLKRELMTTLRGHFRPEFLNRLDEVIVFESLSKAQIEDIVRLQLERVKRAAHAQDIYLHIDDSLVGHLAEEAYQPEFGARELKRQIRQQLETRLATAMLKGEVKEGETVTFFYDAKDGVGYRKGAAPKPAVRKKSGAGETPRGRATAARKPAAKKGAAAKGKADKPKTK